MSATIVGWGLRTPLGLDAVQTGMLYRAGAAAMVPAALGPEGEDVVIAALTALPTSSHGVERAQRLVAPAVAEALAGADVSSLRVLLCLDEELAAADPDGAAALARAVLEATGHGSAPLDVATQGSAGGCFALARGLRDFGRGEHLLLVGVHTDHDPARIARLLAQDRLYAGDNLDAIIPGEAAAAVLLAPPSGAGPTLLATGTGTEAARFDNDLPTAPARGFTEALRPSVAALRAREAKAGWVMSDVTFERWRVREWQTTYLRAQRVLGPPHHVDNPAQRLGDLGAAAVPFFAALAAEAHRAGWAPSSHALALVASDGGARGTLALELP